MHAPQTSTAAEPVLLREASTPNVCPFARDAEAPGLRVDRFAMLFLSLARFVGAAYATDEAGCWEAAHRCADDAVGPIEGPLFVARAAALVRAIRRYRDRDFTYWPPSCNRLSNDESRLMRLIEAARGTDLPAAEQAAAAITGKKRGAKAIREAASEVANLSRAPAMRPSHLYPALRPSAGGFAQRRRA
jgi:hypothetical protein